MKTQVMVLMLSILSSFAVQAQSVDANICGPEHLHWAGNANKIKTSMRERLGALAMGEDAKISDTQVEMYLKSCGLAANAVNPGGCYNPYAKKIVFASTIQADCEAVVVKVRQVEEVLRSSAH